MEKILMKGLENNMTLNNHKRYRYGAEFYNLFHSEMQIYFILVVSTNVFT